MIKQYTEEGPQELTLEGLLSIAKEKKLYGVTVVELEENKEGGYLEEKRRYVSKEDFDDLKALTNEGEWDLWLHSYLTGHMHLNYGGETINSCGNCDGARCDSCERVFTAELEQSCRGEK